MISTEFSTLSTNDGVILFAGDVHEPPTMRNGRLDVVSLTGGHRVVARIVGGDAGRFDLVTREGEELRDQSVAWVSPVRWIKLI